MQIPDTDTSEYAALIEFAVTAGRLCSHPGVERNAGRLIAQFYSARARAMTEALAALAKAASLRQD